MSSHEQDSIIAQQIISSSNNNFYDLDTFHNYSIIYKKSNERIERYQDYLAERNSILSVIASGDQIINCILGGTKEIDAFDISVFPKYFLFLKLAAIEVLSSDEYIDFFYSRLTTSEKYDDYYGSISQVLTGENKEFWDSLFDYFSWFDIYNSTLFSTEIMIKEDVLRQNLYLQKEYFKQLKQLIKNVKINTFDGNIMSLADTFHKEYDLVYLSNILNYVPAHEYKKLLSKLRLKPNGITLTYLFSISNKFRNYFNESNYSFCEFDNIRAGVMIYRK